MNSNFKVVKQLFSVGKRQFSLYNYSDRSNPRVFLTLSKNGQVLGDLVFELYRNQVPENADNFAAFATGNNSLGASYQGKVLDKGFPGIVL